jgi:DNA-binding transcriptional regulator PaaX
MPEQPSTGSQRAGADKHTGKQTGSSERRPNGAAKPEPKKQQLRRLVERKSGATINILMEATGWQAHSVRAALSGLRKDGFAVERRTNRKGETVYALGASDERP